MLLTPQLVALLDVATMIHGSEHDHANEADHQHNDSEHELRIAQCADPFVHGGVSSLTAISNHPDDHQDGVDDASEHHQLADVADFTEGLIGQSSHGSIHNF